MRRSARDHTIRKLARVRKLQSNILRMQLNTRINAGSGWKPRRKLTPVSFISGGKAANVPTGGCKAQRPAGVTRIGKHGATRALSPISRRTPGVVWNRRRPGGLGQDLNTVEQFAPRSPSPKVRGEAPCGGIRGRTLLRAAPTYRSRSKGKPGHPLGLQPKFPGSADDCPTRLVGAWIVSHRDK
jgi:hypothetical protein